TKADPTPKFGKAYVSGNYVDGNEKITTDNWAGGVQFKGGGGEDDTSTVADDETKALIEKVRADKPFPMAPVTTQTAQEAYESVVANAGAILPHRDPVDLRVIEEVKTGNTWAMGQEIPVVPMPGLSKNNVGVAGNGVITAVAQVGGYPDYKGDSF